MAAILCSDSLPSSAPAAQSNAAAQQTLSQLRSPKRGSSPQSAGAPPTAVVSRARRFVRHRRFHHAVVAVLCLSHLHLLLESLYAAHTQELLTYCLNVCFAVLLAAELVLRATAAGGPLVYLRESWAHRLDLAILLATTAALVLPATTLGALHTLRALRTLSVLQLFTSKQEGGSWYKI